MIILLLLISISVQEKGLEFSDLCLSTIEFNNKYKKILPRPTIMSTMLMATRQEPLGKGNYGEVYPIKMN